MKISSEKWKPVSEASENNFLCLRFKPKQKPDAKSKKEEKTIEQIGNFIISDCLKKK